MSHLFWSLIDLMTPSDLIRASRSSSPAHERMWKLDALSLRLRTLGRLLTAMAIGGNAVSRSLKVPSRSAGITSSSFANSASVSSSPTAAFDERR